MTSKQSVIKGIIKELTRRYDKRDSLALDRAINNSIDSWGNTLPAHINGVLFKMLSDMQVFWLKIARGLDELSELFKLVD